jgi:hypothetical protein
MDSVLKLRTTEGWEWPGLYAWWPASLANLGYTGSRCIASRLGAVQPRSPSWTAPYILPVHQPQPLWR